MATLLDEDANPITVARTIIVTPEDPDSDESMHQYAFARLLTFRDDADTFHFQRVSNAAFTGYEAPPPGSGLLAGTRAGWWRYDATADGELQLSTEGEGAAVQFKVFEVLNNAWTLVADQVANLTLITSVPMQAGHSYYVRLSNVGSDPTVQYVQLSGHAVAGPTPGSGATLATVPIVVEVPFAEIVESTDPFDTSQHQYYNAVQVYPDPITGLFEVSVDNTNFTAVENIDMLGPTSVDGNRAAWFYIVPTFTGSLTFQGYGSDYVNSTAWDPGGGTYWYKLGESYGGSGISIDVVDASPVYFRLANIDLNIGQTVTFAGQAPVPFVDVLAAPPIVVRTGPLPAVIHVAKAAAPPVIVAISTPRGHVAGDVDIVEVPPMRVEVLGIAASTHAGTLSIPPIRVGGGVLPLDLRRIRYGIIDPPDVSVLPITAPTLSGYVNVFEGDVDDPGEIVAEFEYGIGTGTSYLQLGVISEPVEIYTSYSLVEATLPVLPGGSIYYWRMRIVVDGEPRAFSVWWSFVVGQPLESVLPVTSTVTVADTYPHLWFIDPPVAAPGETVKLFGYGFPEHETGVTFGSDTLQIVSWDHIAGTAAAGTADRLIIDGQVDPAHDEITVIVPDTEEAGYPLTVLGEDD